eukprot:TRINITY_DN6838_c1_g1_i1.p1 TRINITY_DN6838_c1_g1~~TRINITY_DN6838_c1_g1_i1.p1  ORF type:complete len:546 (+),score=112.88 TRINITY_DN6838_c1_g1_i1:990-2627(+)
MDASAKRIYADVELFKPQELANTVWAFATLEIRPKHPVFDAIAATSITRLTEFTSRNRANIAWSFATLLIGHVPLFDAIAASASAQISELSPLSLASTAWACAKIQLLDYTLIESFSPALIEVGSRGKALDDGIDGMAIWTLSQLEDLRLAFRFAESKACRDASSLSLSPLLAACERRGFLQGELRFFQRLAAQDSSLRPVVVRAAALRLLEEGMASEAQDMLLDIVGTGECQPELDEADSQSFGFALPLPAQTDPHEKELRLLAHVFQKATPRNAQSVCDAIEEFGRDILAPSGQWLKVAGGDKAEVLREAALNAPLGADGLCRILEVGTYCGYSALRMASARSECRVVSIEADPARVAIARCIIAFAGMSHLIDVRCGHSEDVLRTLCLQESALQKTFSGAFLDQRGSRFSDDLQTLEKSGLLEHGAIIVADNVLKPGAPAYLWHVLRGGDYETRLVSLEEFAMVGTEDWMSVSRYLPMPKRSGVQQAPAAPPEIRKLERQAEQMRMRAMARGKWGGVSFADWAAFSRRMSEEFEKVGVGLRR